MRPRCRDGGRADQALVRAGAVGALVGLVPYLGALWDWGLHPLRRMSVAGTNANFYDLQARALFHGHLDVAPGSLGIEAFVVDGRHYMYFGPFPALLRMPLLAVTDRFDGRLTAPSMLVGWCVLAVGLIALMRIVRRVVAPDLEIGRGAQVGVAALMANVLGGSSLVFLASQPWVYHEVYVWSAAGSVVTLTALIHLGVAPTRRALLVAVGAGVATMLTRAPAGWALAAATIATGAWLVVRTSRSDTADRRTGVAVTVGGAATIVIGAGVNWAKFRHPYLFPIQDQVWSQLSAHRQMVLAFNHGRLDGPRFVWSTSIAYFRPDGVQFTTVFPFVWPPAHPPGAVGGVRLDESFRTGSVPALMPLLFFAMLWAAVVVFGRRRRGGLVAPAALRLPLLGAVLATGGVMAFGYIAPRYLADFIPALALGSFVGWADIARRLDRSSGTRARVVVGLVVGLAVYGIVANSALALVNARQNWRGDRLESLVSAQERIGALTGHPLGGHVHEVDELPPDGASDDYYIVGDCHAVYLATGERAGAWVPVQTRPVEFRVVVGDAGVHPGSARLMWFPGFALRQLHLQADRDGHVRLTLVGAPPDSAGRWLAADPGDVIAVSVTSDTARNRYLARAVVADEEPSLTSAPMSEWDRRFDSVQIGAVVTLASDDELAAVGVTATATWGPVPDLCARLRS